MKGCACTGRSDEDGGYVGIYTRLNLIGSTDLPNSHQTLSFAPEIPSKPQPHIYIYRSLQIYPLILRTALSLFLGSIASFRPSLGQPSRLVCGVSPGQRLKPTSIHRRLDNGTIYNPSPPALGFTSQPFLIAKCFKVKIDYSPR